jgi:hypothetical protein
VMLWIFTILVFLGNRESICMHALVFNLSISLSSVVLNIL